MILVTGGTGLVGTHLLYDLTLSGKKVRALKRNTSNLSIVKKVFSYYSKDSEHLLKNIEWVDADLSDVYSLSEAMEGVSEIYHCAAMVSFAQGKPFPPDINLTRLGGQVIFSRHACRPAKYIKQKLLNAQEV